MGMEFRPYYMAREWQKMGHSVRIVAGNYSHLRRKNPDVERDFQNETIDGITYTWLKTGDYEGNGIKRAFSMFHFVGKLRANARKVSQQWKPDVVITSSTYPIDTFAGQKIAQLSHAVYIHEVHDMWPTTLTEIGGMSKWHPFVVLMQIGENSAYRHCNYVVSMLPNAKDYMVKHGLKPEKFVHISNGIVREDWENPAELPPDHEKALSELHASGKFIVGYFGGFALSNDLDTLLDVAREMRNDQTVSFVLVGRGVEKPRLEKRARDEKLDNVLFLDPVSKYSIPKLIDKFDCVYVSARRSPLYTKFGVSMNKIFDSMMGGKPILFAVQAANNPIDEYQCGITVEADNTAAIQEGLRRMAALPAEERRKMGENGKKAVTEHFTYDKLAKQFERLFEKKNAAG